MSFLSLERYHYAAAVQFETERDQRRLQSLQLFDEVAHSARKHIEARQHETRQPKYVETKFEIRVSQKSRGDQLMTEPEQTLWASVLTLAMQDLSGPDHLAKPARAWFSSRNTSLGSLIWICDQLGLDPNAVRQKMLRRRASEISARDRSQDQAA